MGNRFVALQFAALSMVAASCGGKATAPQAPTAATQKPETPRLNYAFVTSFGHSANFGGLAGADAFCAARAKEAGLHGQHYVAWLSTTTVAAPSRLAGARGWMRTDGAPVFDTVDDLKNNQLFHPIRLDENGADAADQSPFGFIPTWTGTEIDYTQTSSTCSDWTSVDLTKGAFAGDAAGGAIIWNRGALYSCAWELPIYCFEADFNVPLVVPHAPAGARLAFLSSDTFTPREGGSIADADAQCAAEAAHANLSGSFKALLADVGRSAAARFNDHLGTWYRLDGIAIVDRAQDLFASGGPRLAAAIDLQADGSRPAPLAPAWTGFAGEVDDYSVPGTAATTCNGWSTSSTSAKGGVSIADFTWKSFLNLPGWPIPSCSGAAQLYCLQE
jgi:hypothetical protein